MGKRLALPFSGISGAFLFFCLTYLTISWLGTLKPHHYWLIGLAWLALTVLFECGFGRTVAHKSWPELLCAYDPTTGNLWILVLISIVLSPVIAANLRGYLR